MTTSGTSQPGLRCAGPVGHLLLLAGFLWVGLASSSVVLKAAAAIAAVGMGRLSGESFRGFLHGLRPVVVFAGLLFVAQALSVREGVRLLPFGPAITAAGLVSGAQMATRFLVIVTSSFLFVSVTDPDRLADCCVRAGVPYRYAFLLVLALRFVPFFRRELAAVRDAQRMRGIRTSVRGVRALRRTIRYTFLPVLAAGFGKVDAITMSMKGRAFGLYSRRTPEKGCLVRGADLALGIAAAGLAACVVFAERAGWP